MKIVAGQYCVVLGKGDVSDSIDYDIALTDEEAAAYDAAIENEIPFEDVPELEAALERAYAEIEEMEIENGIDLEDEYVLECRGLVPMDEDKLNELVRARDSYALAFFGLKNATDEEIEAWDAYNLDEVPMIADFREDFEPESPYDRGWRLIVEFVYPEEEF